MNDLKSGIDNIEITMILEKKVFYVSVNLDG